MDNFEQTIINYPQSCMWCGSVKRNKITAQLCDKLVSILWCYEDEQCRMVEKNIFTLGENV